MDEDENGGADYNEFTNIAGTLNQDSARKQSQVVGGASYRQNSRHNNQTIDEADDKESQQLPDSGNNGDDGLNLKPSIFNGQHQGRSSQFTSGASPDKLNLNF